MQAVILAAGKSRISQGFPLNYKPKCLLHCKGEVILEHDVKLLRKHGIKTIIVVVGYQASKIKKFAKKRKLRLKYVLAKQWTAGLATFLSFMLGSKAVTNKNFLLILGDVIVSEELLMNLLRCKSDFCINKGGQIMAVKLKKKGLGNLGVIRKELLSYKPVQVRRHMLSMGFDRYLRKRGAQVVRGKFREIDSFWISDEGIIARKAIKRFDV